jgi:hypothetical protein
MELVSSANRRLQLLSGSRLQGVGGHGSCDPTDVSFGGPGGSDGRSDRRTWGQPSKCTPMSSAPGRSRAATRTRGAQHAHGVRSHLRQHLAVVDDVRAPTSSIWLPAATHAFLKFPAQHVDQFAEAVRRLGEVEPSLGRFDIISILAAMVLRQRLPWCGPRTCPLRVPVKPSSPMTSSSERRELVLRSAARSPVGVMEHHRLEDLAWPTALRLSIRCGSSSLDRPSSLLVRCVPSWNPEAGSTSGTGR